MTKVKVKMPMPNMSRAHVRGMMCTKQGLGFAAAYRVLEARKALPEHYTFLEELQKQRLAAERLAEASSEEEGAEEGCEPGCGVCQILAHSKPAKPKYRLADLLQEYPQTDRHSEFDWGRSEGVEVW